MVPRYILQAQRPNLESKNGRIRRPPIRICEKRNRTLFLPSCFPKLTPPQKKGTARPSFVSTLLELPKVSSSPLDASFDSTTTTDDEVSSSDYDFSFSSDDTEVAKDIITDDHDHDIRWTANSMYSGTSVPSPTSHIHVHVTDLCHSTISLLNTTSFIRKIHSPGIPRRKASIDTTITTLSHFILAMVQHPHVLQRAQEELDNVLRSRGDGLGSSQSVADRLPTFEDRAKLPYCDAVFTETLRWGVPVPLSECSTFC